MKYIVEPRKNEYGYCKICGEQCNGRCPEACGVDKSSFEDLK